jgi:nucleotide-binding universal stress UspA family protein
VNVMADESSAANSTPGAHADKGRWAHPSVLLVATDLSDLDRLMPFALEQALETKARLILLHVLAPATPMSADTVGMPYCDPAGSLEVALEALSPCCELARRHNIACNAVAREGHAARQIEEAIREFQADRILLGTRSRTKLGKLLLGSVAEQVLRSANIPVITVGPEAHLPVAPDGHKRVVLHATTLRETSRPSAALACQIAASQGATLVLLHVLPPLDEPTSEWTGRSGQPSGLDNAALHELRVLAGQTGAGCCSAVEAHVVHGNPSIEILAGAVERQATLIVLGATDRSAFQNLTRDRTIYQVLAHARCPVLTLREPQGKLHSGFPEAGSDSIGIEQKEETRR